jgi:hypothetical protein
MKLSMRLSSTAILSSSVINEADSEASELSRSPSTLIRAALRGTPDSA